MFEVECSRHSAKIVSPVGQDCHLKGHESRDRRVRVTIRAPAVSGAPFTIEARSQRDRRYLSRPLGCRANLLIRTIGNAVNETGPSKPPGKLTLISLEPYA